MVTPASMWRSRIRRRASASTRARSARELTPRITAGSSETWAATRPPASLQQRQHVREVVLALGVVVGERRQHRRQRRAVEGVDAGVDLADRELVGGRIAGAGLRLDDPLDLAVGAADDAAVGARVVENRR